MAKIMLNIEFDSVAELREFMSYNPLPQVVQPQAAPVEYEYDYDDDEEQKNDNNDVNNEQPKKRRRRRTKAEILAEEAAKQKAAEAPEVAEERPVVREVNGEVLPPAPELPPQVVPVIPPPPIQPLPRFSPAVIPTFNPNLNEPNLTMQPTVSINPVHEHEVKPAPLPSDLLSALGGTLGDSE